VDLSGESEEVGRLPAPGYSSFPALPGTSGEIIIQAEGEFRRILARARRVIKFHSLCLRLRMRVRVNMYGRMKGEQESGEWHS